MPKMARVGVTNMESYIRGVTRVPPHFGLWLKIFNVKPKVVDRQHAECGGAMVSKLPKVNWPKEVFVDTVKIWQ